MNRTKLLALTGIALLIAAVAALGAPSHAGRARAATQTISVGNNFYSPTALTIQVGDTVQWDWPAAPNAVPHTVTSDSPSSELDSPLQATGSYSHMFTVAGTYDYHCEVHPSMMGTITVQAAATTTATSTTAATNTPGTRTPTRTATASPTRTTTPAATATVTAIGTPIITPTHTSGLAPTVAPAPTRASGGAVSGLPSAGTGSTGGGASPRTAFGYALGATGMLALIGAALGRRRASATRR